MCTKNDAKTEVQEVIKRYKKRIRKIGQRKAEKNALTFLMKNMEGALIF